MGVDRTVWEFNIQPGSSLNVLKKFEDALANAKKSINQVADAGENFNKLSSLQTKAAEAAKKVEVAQASAALAVKKASDAATGGKASTEQLALMQSKAALAAEKVKTAEDAAGNAMQKAAGEAQRLAKESAASAEKTGFFAKAMSGLKDHVAQATSGLASGFKNAAGNLLEFGSRVGMTVFGIQQLVQGAQGLSSALVGSNADMEQTTVAFGTLLHSGDAASKMVKDLWKFAAETPFEFPDITNSAKHMLAFGFSAQSILPMLHNVGDAVSALGGGAFEIDRVTTALGQMQAKGKVNAQDMMQLAEVGIPAWQLLSDGMGVTTAEAQKMSENGLLPAGKAINILLDGMGKAFGGGMQAQSKTFNGLLSTFKDNTMAAWRAFTGPLFEQSKASLIKLGELVTSPAFQRFATDMGVKVGGAIASVASFVNTQLIPAFQRLWGFISQNIIPAFQTASTWFSDFVGRGQAGIPIIAGIAAAVGTLLVGAFLALDIAISPVALAIAGIALAVGGLTAIFLHFYNTSAGFRDFISGVGVVMQQIGGFIKDTFTPVWQQLQDVWKSQLQPALQELWASFKQLQPELTIVGEIIGGVLLAALGLLIFELGGMIGAIAGMAHGIAEIFSGIVQIVTGYVQIIAGIIAFVVDLFTGHFDRLGGDLKVILGGIGEIFKGFGNVLKGIVDGIAGGVVGGFKGMATSSIGYLDDLVNGIDRKTKEAKEQADLHTMEMKIATIKNAEGMDLGVIQKLDHMRMGVADQLRQTKDDTERQTLTIKLKHIEAAETQRVAVWEKHKEMRKNVEDEHTKLKKHIEDTSGGIIGSIQRFFGGIGNWFHDRWVDVQNVFGGIGAWFHDKWSEAWGATTSVFGAIGQWFHDRWVDVQNIWGGVGQWFNDRGRDIWGGITSFFGAIGQWFSDRWAEVMNATAPFRNYMSRVFETIWNILVALWGKLGQWLGDRFTEARNKIVEIFGPIGQWFQDRWADIKNVFGAVGAWFHQKFSEAWGAVTGFFGFLGQWFGDRWSETKVKLAEIGGWFHQKFTEAWNATTGAFQFLGNWFNDRWTQVKTFLAPIGTWFRDKFQEARNFVTAVFSPIGNWFRDRWNETLVHVTNFKNSAIAKFNELKDGAANAFKGLVNSIVDQLNNGINAVERFINFIGQGLDNIATSLGTKGTIPVAHLGRIPRYASGTEGHPGGPMIVGEEGPELLVAPRGTAVLSSPKTMDLLAMMGGKIPGYAGGIGDLGSQIMGWIGGGARAVLDNVMNAMNIKAPDLGPMSNIASGIFNKVKDWAVGWIDKILPKFDFGGGGGSAVNVPGNVQSWIAQAMALTHAPANWAGALATIAMHESGGNPAAINLTDSNARAGHPSQGLFQTIPSTFAAHALPGHGNILNPVDNAAAAIGYIVGRYGTVFNVPGIASMARGGPYVGYARGGFITEPILGMGLRTGTSYGFGEAGNEIVMPMAGFASPGGAFGGGSGNTEQYLASIAADLHTLVLQGKSGGTTLNANVAAGSLNEQRINQAIQSLGGYAAEMMQRGAW